MGHMADRHKSKKRDTNKVESKSQTDTKHKKWDTYGDFLSHPTAEKKHDYLGHWCGYYHSLQICFI